MPIHIDHDYFELRIKMEAVKRGIKSLPECVRIICFERINETDRVAAETVSLPDEPTQTTQAPPDGEQTE